MTPKSTACDRAHEVRFEALADAIDELKARVLRLENVLTRGMTLLIANLIGVATLLAQQVLQGQP